VLYDINEGFFKILIFGPRNHGNMISMVTGPKNQNFKKSFIHFIERPNTNPPANL